jgi:hypothetical protein
MAASASLGTVNPPNPPNPPNGNSDRAFYFVFTVVFLITVTCLGLGLWKGSQRTQYVNQESTRLISRIPKGDVSNSPTPEDIQRQKDIFDHETNDQENLITILMGVFQAGTGAIIGLLTGKATAK